MLFFRKMIFLISYLNDSNPIESKYLRRLFSQKYWLQFQNKWIKSQKKKLNIFKTIKCISFTLGRIQNLKPYCELYREIFRIRSCLLSLTTEASQNEEIHRRPPFWEDEKFLNHFSVNLRPFWHKKWGNPKAGFKKLRCNWNARIWQITSSMSQDFWFRANPSGGFVYF